VSATGVSGWLGTYALPYIRAMQTLVETGV
jgi:hypothetical protein